MLTPSLTTKIDDPNPQEEMSLKSSTSPQIFECALQLVQGDVGPAFQYLDSNGRVFSRDSDEYYLLVRNAAAIIEQASRSPDLEVETVRGLLHAISGQAEPGSGITLGQARRSIEGDIVGKLSYQVSAITIRHLLEAQATPLLSSSIFKDFEPLTRNLRNLSQRNSELNLPIFEGLTQALRELPEGLRVSLPVEAKRSPLVELLLGFAETAEHRDGRFNKEIPENHNSTVAQRIKAIKEQLPKRQQYAEILETLSEKLIISEKILTRDNISLQRSLKGLADRFQGATANLANRLESMERTSALLTPVSRRD
ncbi:MAG: hypothetical protein KDD62_10685 [Bdellovibrionales bacterium]|nr:hypothetical protein [Bdellovibrionales bacterium]